MRKLMNMNIHNQMNSSNVVVHQMYRFAHQWLHLNGNHIERSHHLEEE